MTHDKAREYFSAYHEGSLEPGLRASLERDLRADGALRAEYDAFAATLDALGGLRHEAIESPLYLSDRIATRLESARETKRAPFWAAWLSPQGGGFGRPAYALGLACAFLAAAVGLRKLDNPDVEQAGFVGTSAGSVVWSQDGRDLRALFAPGAGGVATVTPEGGEPQRFPLAAGQRLDLTLQNPNRAAKRFKIEEGKEPALTVAIPGARALPRAAGTGTVTELASALADRYGVAVVVKGERLGETVVWDLKGTDARVAAQESLGGKVGVVEIRDGVLQIGP